MKNLIKQIGQHGLDNLKEQREVWVSELHHELYNMDYFIVGTFEAEKFLTKFGLFKAIKKVTQYEKDQFGEVTTDISNPEQLVNMLAYVIGDELLQECQTINNRWDERLAEKDLKMVAKELKEAIKNYQIG